MDHCSPFHFVNMPSDRFHFLLSRRSQSFSESPTSCRSNRSDILSVQDAFHGAGCLPSSAATDKRNVSKRTPSRQKMGDRHLPANINSDMAYYDTRLSDPPKRFSTVAAVLLAQAYRNASLCKTLPRNPAHPPSNSHPPPSPQTTRQPPRPPQKPFSSIHYPPHPASSPATPSQHPWQPRSAPPD